MKSFIFLFLTLTILNTNICYIFLSLGTEEEKDQLDITCIEDTGPDNAGILCYPKELSTTKKHGIVIWGPGGGSTPKQYLPIIHRISSHGFVVYALSSSPGDASKATEGIEWLKQLNEGNLNETNINLNELKDKLDMNIIGCAGHSMGGLESEAAVIKIKEVKTAFLLNSGDLAHEAMGNVPIDKTIGVCYGKYGIEKDNAELDYGNKLVKAPACKIMMDGMGYDHGSCVIIGMAATVAWMRWHLGGEDFRKMDFLEEDGKYVNGPVIGDEGNWNGTCKNF